MFEVQDEKTRISWHLWHIFQDICSHCSKTDCPYTKKIRPIHPSRCSWQSCFIATRSFRRCYSRQIHNYMNLTTTMSYGFSQTPHLLISITILRMGGGYFSYNCIEFLLRIGCLIIVLDEVGWILIASNLYSLEWIVIIALRTLDWRARCEFYYVLV